LTFDDAKAEKYQQQTNVKEEESLSPIYLVTDGVESSYTKKGYHLAFNDFLRTLGWNQDPEALRVLLDLKPSIIESRIINYIKSLKERKLSASTIRIYCSPIFHFFEINDVHINTRKIKRFFPLDESEHYSTDRPYSVNEIKQILDKCDIRSRVIILLMASTGMRIGALLMDKEGRPGIRLGDLKKNDEFGLYMIWVYSYSKKHRYYTFCTPECASAIDAYLAYRKKFGEELKDKSPLIREQFNIDNPFTVKSPRFLSRRMMAHIFDDVLKRSGINQLQPGQKRRDVMTSHGFRKFFITECDRANMSYSVREFLAGHRLPNNDPHYVYRTEEDRLAEYVKVIDRLTINQEHKLQKKVQELEGRQAQKIALLEERLNNTEKSFSEWKNFTAGLEALNIRHNNTLYDFTSYYQKRLKEAGLWTKAEEEKFEKRYDDCND
jgi:integrase